MSDPLLRGSEALNEDSVNDVRWRLESAMEKLDDGLLLTALDLIHEAGLVVEAMDERWKRERREMARREREALEGPADA